MATQTGAEHLNLPTSEILKAKDKKIEDLEKQVEELRQALASQKANEELKLQGHVKKEEDASEDEEGDDDIMMDEGPLDEDDSDSEMTPYVDFEPGIEGEPLWVLDEHLYRCSVCGTEIVERRCEGCNRSYKNWICEETPDSEPLDENYLDVVYQKREKEDYRMAEQRETTPLRDINDARLHPDTVAYDYGDRVEEYKSLLARGATRMMCETFHLSYSQDTGIWLQIKDDLLQEWAGPKMLSPAFISWKVCLGREIVLDKEDEDGSVYVDEFLEEALLFGGRTGGTLAWRTVEASPGEWVTRPFVDAASAPDHTADVREWFEVGQYLGNDEEWAYPEQVAKNDYESDKSGDEEEDNDSDGMVQLGWDGEGGYGPDGDRSDEEAQMSDPAPESEGDDTVDSDWDSDTDEEDT